MNPLDWKGPEFLALYLPLLLGGFIAVVMLRWRMRTPDGDPLRDSPRLDVDTYELALLQHDSGPVDAAVASLLHRGDLALEDGKPRAVRHPLEADPFERAVYGAVRQGAATLTQVRDMLRAEHERLRERLVRKGLLLDEGTRTQAWLVPVLVYGLILALGFTKLYLGFTRHKPSTFLFLALCPATLCAFFLLVMRPRNSRLGDKTLAALKQQHAALRTAVSSEGAGKLVGSRDLALAVGLFGVTVLSTAAFADLRNYLAPPSSDGGGGGDGDGGGDGGSCGGGGCGGCGGGD